MSQETSVASSGSTVSDPMYQASLENLDPGTRHVLETYSGVAPDQVIPHIMTIRERGYKVHPYPCIGQFRFTDLSIGLDRRYPEILERVKAGQKLLDLGCCFGQDIRKLVADGAPSENLWGCDLVPAFHDLGYDLFLDRDTIKSHFVSADIFDTSETDELSKTKGMFDIIHASSFFHLFTLGRQKTAALRALSLLKTQPGTSILGRQAGTETPGQRQNNVTQNLSYRHNETTLKQFWEEVAKEIGLDVRVETARDYTGRWKEAKSFASDHFGLRYSVVVI